MALYRFLFAPALLALAVLAGPGEQGQVVRADPPRVVASEPMPRPAAEPARPLAPAALERAVAAKHTPRRAAPARTVR
jgi:hypothetical protein